MKYPVWPDTTPHEIPGEIKEIHLVRPISSKRLLEIVSKKGIRKVFSSKSSLKRLSRKTTDALEKIGVQIEIEQKRGRPLSMPMEKVKEVVELHKDYQSLRKIEKITGIPKSTIHYLLKYASRQKIKGGKKVLYL